MSRDDEALHDIVAAGGLAGDFLGDMDKSAFAADAKTQSAVLHQLLVIGEAVKRLSQDFRNRHPDIPFVLIAGMRNKLIHEYDDIDLDEVWNTVTRDIPDVLKRIKALMSSDG